MQLYVLVLATCGAPLGGNCDFLIG